MKKYIAPCTKLIRLQEEYNLLTGSIIDNSGPSNRFHQGNGESNLNDPIWN